MKKISFLFSFLLVSILHANMELPVNFGFEDFFTGKKLTLEHNFKNNILAVGNRLNFTGKSFEDVLLIGINVNFNGSSDKDVYIAGDSVFISGFIKGNLRVVARNIEARNLVIGGNVSFISPEVLIHDEVEAKGPTKIWSRDIQIGGKYDTLYIKTKNVIFTKNILVEKKLIVQSKEKPAIPLNVLKRCEFIYQPPVPRPAQIFLSQKFMKLYSFLSLCFPFILMIIFTPRLLQETIEIIEKKPVWTFSSGLLLLMMVPVVLIFMMITIIGAPIGLIFLTFYISLLYLCRGFTCIALGRLILWKLKEGKIKIILGVFLGTGVFVLLTAIPKAGYIFQFLFLTMGFGGFFIGRIRMFIRMRKENII